MTTIAYRDGVLAADTAMTKGGTLLGSIIKIARNDKGDLAGATGNATYNAAFLQWFAAGETGDPPLGSETETNLDRGVIFRSSGVIEVREGPEPRPYTCSSPYFAFGSGSDIAIGAMWYGADAANAVHAAIEHDPNTGGSVTILRHTDE